MAASYPGVVKTYTDKVDGVDYVKAADINSVQQELQAVETALGANVATSSLPSAGSYNANGVSTSLTARLTNVEAGLTAAATDGSRVGYTQLAQQTIVTTATANSTTFSSISGSYQKLVLNIGVTGFTSGGSQVTTLTLNGVVTGYAYTAQVYGTATPTTSTGDTKIPLGTPVATSYSAVLEIPNYASTYGGKNWSLLGTDRSATGYLATTAITSITVSVAGTSTMVVQCTLFGVK